MPDATVATNLNEPLNVKVNFFSKFALNLVFVVDKFPETVNLVFSEAIRLGIIINTKLF